MFIYFYYYYLFFGIREEKNYTPVAKKLLEEKLLAVMLEKDGIKIKNIKLNEITGEASVNIRK